MITGVGRPWVRPPASKDEAPGTSGSPPVPLLVPEPSPLPLPVETLTGASPFEVAWASAACSAGVCGVAAAAPMPGIDPAGAAAGAAAGGPELGVADDLAAVAVLVDVGRQLGQRLLVGLLRVLLGQGAVVGAVLDHGIARVRPRERGDEQEHGEEHRGQSQHQRGKACGGHRTAGQG